MWSLAKDNFNVRKGLKRIQCPVYIIYGTEDYMSSVETGLKIYEAMGVEKQNIELISFPDCGHFPHLEQPDLTAKHIFDFI